MTNEEFAASKKLIKAAVDWSKRQLQCKSDDELRDVLVDAINGITILNYSEDGLKMNKDVVEHYMSEYKCDLKFLEALVKYLYKNIIIYKFVNNVTTDNNK